MIPYKPIKKKLTDKENEQLVADVASNVFEKIMTRHEHSSMFVPHMNQVRFGNREEVENMINVELKLVAEKLPKSANPNVYDYNIPHYPYHVIYTIIDLANKNEKLKNEFFPQNNQKTFQNVLDEIDVEHYSITSGHSRTITKNHNSPIIASIVIKELSYAVGIVKTPRTFQCFEIMKQSYNTKLCLLTVKEVIMKIERLNNKTIKADINEKEYAIMKDAEIVNAL